MNEHQQLSIRLPEPLYAELEQYAVASERSLAAVVRLALIAYLRNNIPQQSPPHKEGATA